MIKKKILFSIVAFILILGSLTGCKENDNQNDTLKKQAVAFLIANTGNSQGINLESQLVQDTVYDVIRHDGYILILNVDGVPDMAYSKEFEVDNKGGSEAKHDLDARILTNDVLTCMKSVIANDPETDYMASLQLASRALNSLSGEYDSKSVIILGTGLSSAGVLNFQNNVLSADPKSIVDMLADRKEIPDMSSLSVYWQQLADTKAPQRDLNSMQKQKLQDIYTAIIEAGGGTLKFDDSLPVTAEDTNYPTVTPIDIPDETPMVFDSTDINTEEDLFEEPIALTEEQLHFVGDKAEFLEDTQEVLNVLEPIATYMKERNESILLVGTTAGDTDDKKTLQLSYERAKCLKNVLVQNLNVDEKQCKAIGVGSHGPWHVSGLDPQKQESAVNRRVFLLKADSEIAQSILKEEQ